MARRKTPSAADPDRFIVKRGGTYHYKRRVPAVLGDVDERAPHVRISLKTAEMSIARQKRDALEAADDALWGELLAGDQAEAAKLRYDGARKRAEALGFRYRPAAEIATGPIDDLVARLEALSDERKAPPAVRHALLGTVDAPKVTMTAAFQRFLDDIAPAELVGKSDEQKRQWRKTFRRAVNNFVELNGDVPIDEVTREHALKVYDFWNARIAPKQGRPSHTPSSGNRDLGNLRGFFRDYFRHLGDRDRQNPFADLSFAERRRATRPPFPTAFIRDELLKPGALASLNDEARGCVLAMVETGMRPSEIANIQPHHILLDVEIPHVLVEPREDPEDPRELKTAASVRAIPLVGVSLAAFKKHPNGFPRYREREATLSATVNKHLTEHKLRPTPRHTLYSLRHSFEDRMKEGHVDAELRMILMGHSIDRPQYGSGGSLEWRQQALQRIVLPFDPAIVAVAKL